MKGYKMLFVLLFCAANLFAIDLSSQIGKTGFGTSIVGGHVCTFPIKIEGMAYTTETRDPVLVGTIIWEEYGELKNFLEKSPILLESLGIAGSPIYIKNEDESYFLAGGIFDFVREPSFKSNLFLVMPFDRLIELKYNKLID